MDELWNSWDVKPPPVCFVKTEIHSKEISNLNDVTFNALKTMRDLNHFDREAAILSRFLYKHKRTFRHDKGMQNLVKVSQCLKRYLKLDLCGVLSTLKQNVSRNSKQKTTTAYLPTKQMLKWVLLRLQAFSRLFVRVIDLAKKTGSYIYKKLHLGWSLNYSLMVFCISARILTTAKFLVSKSIEWYSSFYKFLPHLQETAEFLPGYKFPTDLKVWLGDVDLIPLKKQTVIDDVFELIDLSNENEDEDGNGEEDDESEVKILNEKFVKAIFNKNIVNIDSDVEEILIEEEKEERKAVKRPAGQINEDFGVPVNEDEEEVILQELPEKKFRQKGAEKRKKWSKFEKNFKRQ